MNTRISTIGLGVFALTALVMTAPTAFAETVNLKASLKAADSVPPNTSNGTGGLQATYDTANKQLTYTVTYSGLTGNATAAHFHGPCRPGQARRGRRSGARQRRKSDKRNRHADRCPGRRPLGRKMVLQRPYRGEQTRRDSWPGYEVTAQRYWLRRECRR